MLIKPSSRHKVLLVVYNYFRVKEHLQIISASKQLDTRKTFNLTSVGRVGCACFQLDPILNINSNYTSSIVACSKGNKEKLIEVQVRYNTCTTYK